MRANPPVKRSTTLGPSEPIYDWEIERATVLIECREYRERAELFEKKREEDQLAFEKTTASLLREVKMKEAMLEKRLEDTEQRWMAQIQDMQRHLEEEKEDHLEQVKELRERYDKTLEAEQDKHTKRLTSLQNRLGAKDMENTRLNEAVMGGQRERMELEQLRHALARERAEREEERAVWTTTSSLSSCPTSPSSSTPMVPSPLPPLPNTSPHTSPHTAGTMEAIEAVVGLEAQVVHLTRKLSQMKEKHITKASHLKDNVQEEVERVKEMFLHESRRTSMQHEAQIQNLKSEHTETLRELEEQFENEKQVWQIEQQTATDELTRQLKRDHQNAMREMEMAWKEKLADLESLMSMDALSVQNHWESRLSQIQKDKDITLAHLLGQIQVMKGRLGNEIEKRRQCQGTLEVMQQKESVDMQHIAQYQQQTVALVHANQVVGEDLSKVTKRGSGWPCVGAEMSFFF
ncbi:hypothetical protein BDF14DRAFT_1727615 [Spinellus fusiger]|nr:hypothetical protein BDF14DRAFT_1727615 [Spinellus fusiger]